MTLLKTLLSDLWQFFVLCLIKDTGSRVNDERNGGDVCCPPGGRVFTDLFFLHGYTVSRVPKDSGMGGEEVTKDILVDRQTSPTGWTVTNTGTIPLYASGLCSRTTLRFRERREGPVSQVATTEVRVSPSVWEDGDDVDPSCPRVNDLPMCGNGVVFGIVVFRGRGSYWTTRPWQDYLNRLGLWFLVRLPVGKIYRLSDPILNVVSL